MLFSIRERRKGKLSRLNVENMKRTSQKIEKEVEEKDVKWNFFFNFVCFYLFSKVLLR